MAATRSKTFAFSEERGRGGGVLAGYVSLTSQSPYPIIVYSVATKKFLCFSSNEIGLLWFLSLALSFLCYPRHLDIEIKSKKRIGFYCCSFYLEKAGKLCDLPPKRAGA